MNENFLDKSEYVTVRSKMPFAKNEAGRALRVSNLFFEKKQIYETRFIVEEFTPKKLSEYMGNFIELISKIFDSIKESAGEEEQGNIDNIDIISKVQESDLDLRNIGMILGVYDMEYLGSILLTERDKIKEVFERVNPKAQSMFDDIKKKLEEMGTLYRKAI